MKISIIVPNFNGSSILTRNLPHVLVAMKQYVGDVQLIIVDDGSSDNSTAVINNFIADNNNFEIKFFENKKNLGFSSTVNRGAKESSGEILVLLNSDVEPKPDFLTQLVKDFSEENVFAVGCMDESEEQGKVVQRGRGIGSIRRGFLVHRRGEISKNTTLWAAGGSSAFRRSLWDKLGGMDELYNPFYWDDIDLSYRALKSGYKIIFESKSVVIHRHEEGSIKKNYSQDRVKKIAYRNQFFFVWKNFDSFNIISHMLWLPYHLSRALVSLNVNLIIGFFMALLKLPEVLKSRSKAVSYFTKKDWEIIGEFSR